MAGNETFCSPPDFPDVEFFNQLLKINLQIAGPKLLRKFLNSVVSRNFGL